MGTRKAPLPAGRRRRQVHRRGVPVELRRRRGAVPSLRRAEQGRLRTRAPLPLLHTAYVVPLSCILYMSAETRPLAPYAAKASVRASEVEEWCGPARHCAFWTQVRVVHDGQTKAASQGRKLIPASGKS